MKRIALVVCAFTLFVSESDAMRFARSTAAPRGIPQSQRSAVPSTKSDAGAGSHRVTSSSQRRAVLSTSELQKLSSLVQRNAAPSTSGSQVKSQDKVFTLRTTPPVEVIQSLSQEWVILNKSFQAKGISLGAGSTFNGISMKAPLVLKYDMTETEIVSALRKAFGYTGQIDIRSLTK